MRWISSPANGNQYGGSPSAHATDKITHLKLAASLICLTQTSHARWLLLLVPGWKVEANFMSVLYRTNLLDMFTAGAPDRR